jgi:hypothetical protein
MPEGSADIMGVLAQHLNPTWLRMNLLERYGISDWWMYRGITVCLVDLHSANLQMGPGNKLADAKLSEDLHVGQSLETQSRLCCKDAELNCELLVP